MKIVYPVLFYEEENGQFSAFVPDLNNASTYGNSLDDAISMAEELIAGIVICKIEDNESIPESSKIEKVSFSKLEEYLNIKDWKYKSKFKTYVMIDTKVFEERFSRDLVKKTVNIPKWLNIKAEELHVNFSKTLEEALLGIISKRA